jgi:hypothetical protein
MIVLSALLQLVVMVSSVSNQTINADSIRTIFADGQRAHDITVEMLDGTSITLIHNDGGMLWLGNSSYNHRWFEMVNKSWNKQKQAKVGVIICDVTTMTCKPEDDIGDSSFAFDKFFEKTPEFQMISKKRLNGKFAKRILPLDSFEVRFRSPNTKYVQP